MKQISLEQELRNNTYPGRGTVIRRSEDGNRAATAHFIIGGSASGRNRVFAEDGEEIRTQASDPTRLEDPGLIAYVPVRALDNKTIMTNGDQTDTICEGMDHQMTFEQSLRSREFKPDTPSYTPGISGIMRIENDGYSYTMSILKSDNGNPDSCPRFTYTCEAPAAGEGRFIRAYMHDGDPLPSFEGEPRAVGVSRNVDQFTGMIWSNLDQDNKVSLFIHSIDIASGAYKIGIANKNK